MDSSTLLRRGQKVVISINLLFIVSKSPQKNVIFYHFAVDVQFTTIYYSILYCILYKNAKSAKL